MGAVPLARGGGAEAHGHLQHLTGVVAAAAHLHEVGVGREVLGAHLGAGLETARGEDDGAGLDLVATLGSVDDGAGHFAVVANQGADPAVAAQLHTGFVAHLDPLFHQTETATGGCQHGAGVVVLLAVAVDASVEEAPLVAELGHPGDGVAGVLHQHRGQLGIDAVLGDLEEVGGEHVGGVGAHPDAVVAEILGEQREDVLGAAVDETEAHQRVAAASPDVVAGGLLEHHHSLRSSVAGGDRRRVSGAGAAYDQNVDLLAHDNSSRSGSDETGLWFVTVLGTSY